MSAPKFMPGPWTPNLPERCDGALLCSHVVADGISVAQLAHHDDAIIRANAHLIAAAPELYSIANRVVVGRWFVAIDGVPFKIEQADAELLTRFEMYRRAALAKAEGR